MTDLSTLWHFPLRKGKSEDPRNGACLLDAVSWLEYGTLGDHPPCVCPVIAAFARGINDAMPNTGRQRLRVFIPRLVGTVDPAAERARAEYLAWQAIRVFAPIALDAAGRHEDAERLRRFEGTLANAARSARAIRTAAGAGAAAAAYAAGAANAARAGGSTVRAAGAPAYAARAIRTAAGAYAARSAAYAAGDAAMIAALDGVLRIGRQASDPDVIAYGSAVARFAEESAS